ncbi:peptidase M24 [Bacteroidales bacterium]|nr:peptidase M24 [Bacteroidales bacterium]
MNNKQNTDLVFRQKKVQVAIEQAGVSACLIASNVNLYYLSGTIFDGYIYIPAQGDLLYFVRRGSLDAVPESQIFSIRKPEDIPSVLEGMGLSLPKDLLLEADQLTYNECMRLKAAFNLLSFDNATPLLRKLRSVKSAWEIGQFRISAAKHAQAYSTIKGAYHSGISDLEFQANIEREMRLLGSIGAFRGFGSSMEIFMGSILVGDNASTPSPFDFALGGGGIHPSVPVGANGSILSAGKSVMVDMVGNYTAYLSDMTRVFSVGKLPDIAYRAHQVSIDIQEAIALQCRPGASCAELYELSVAMVKEAKLSEYFMGTKQQAKFIGHGVGIEINELPIFSPRSRDLIEQGNVFALEPKFVLPGIGAVGTENTYLMGEKGLEKLTIFDESITIF